MEGRRRRIRIGKREKRIYKAGGIISIFGDFGTR